jgi:hypothetical protein
MGSLQYRLGGELHELPSLFVEELADRWLEVKLKQLERSLTDLEYSDYVQLYGVVDL